MKLRPSFLRNSLLHWVLFVVPLSGCTNNVQFYPPFLTAIAPGRKYEFISAGCYLRGRNPIILKLEIA